MNILIVLFALFIFLFGFVVLFGAPYLPTFSKQSETALDLLNLKPGQALLELGCGDGRVLAAAAKRGIRATGYELNPLLVIYAWVSTRRYGKNVRVRWGNYWQVDWPPTDGIYVFLLDKYMEKLDKTIVQKYSGQNIKLASFAFKLPGRKAYKIKDGVYLYIYGD